MLDPALVARVHERLTLPDGSRPMMGEPKDGYNPWLLTEPSPKPADGLAVLRAVQRKGWHYKLVSYGHTDHLCVVLFDSRLVEELAHSDGDTITEAIYRAVDAVLGG